MKTLPPVVDVDVDVDPTTEANADIDIEGMGNGGGTEPLRKGETVAATPTQLAPPPPQ